MSENFKQEKLKNFTVIRNEIIEDKDLSLKALGLAIFMLHLPPDWEFSVAGLSVVTGKGESTIKTALKELEERGYLKREQSMKDGKFGHMIYIITDKLEGKDFTSAENTPARNHRQINTKETNTKETSNISSSLRSEDIHSEFESLWSEYPRKQGSKDKALGYYERARKNGTTYEEVEKGIRAYKDYIEANAVEMRYVKAGQTFFSQKAWESDWSIRYELKGDKANGKRVGQIHDRATKQDSRGLAEADDRSRSHSKEGIRFPEEAYRFSEFE